MHPLLYLSTHILYVKLADVDVFSMDAVAVDVSSTSSRSNPQLSKLADYQRSCASLSGCPFKTRGCPRSKDTPPALSTDRSNTSLPDVFPGDEEISLAYQAIKAKRRSSMMSNNTHPPDKPPLMQSPVATMESRHLGHPSPSPSTASASASECPIRFLGHMSPEEVAEYFKNHKHELPKSHEICVKRQQSNTKSIRELDAKYVNIVSMIQGLGEKHQPLLPEKRSEGETVEKIHHWAAGLEPNPGGSDLAAGADGFPVGHDEGRGGVLETEVDTQLKEIRLGESPTRPWGVHVPFAAISSSSTSTPCALSTCDGQKIAISSPSLRANVVRSDSGAPPGIALEINQPRPNQFCCPETTCQRSSLVEFKSFADLARHYLDEHDQSTPAPKKNDPPEETDPRPEKTTNNPSPAAPPPMYFTGPIFIGYSAQEAMEISRQFS